MVSLMYRDPALVPFEEQDKCKAGRTEKTVVIRKDGRLIRMVLRDKVVIEDPYLVGLKAAAYAIANNEPYNGTPAGRPLKDFLIKSNVVI